MPKSALSDNADNLPDDFWQGIDQFNRGEYYDCHDTLEALWMNAPQAQKTFYQGILQISVGLYHLLNRNWRGAAILLGEGNNRLQSYEPDYGGINVSNLVDQAYDWMSALQEVGPESVEILATGLESRLTLDMSSDAAQDQKVSASQVPEVNDQTSIKIEVPRLPKIERVA